jgi:hypothetical protein
MTPFTNPHSLFRDASPRARPRRSVEGSQDGSQSGYCFLFPELAKKDDVGCFAGTTAAQSFAKLLEFEQASRAALSSPQVLPMRLPAIYTYFGQFVNHDISAPVGDVVTLRDPPEPVGVISPDLPPGLERSEREAPGVILDFFVNEQVDPLGLDSLYGDGPRSADPSIRALYEADGMRFRLGKTRTEVADFFEALGIEPGDVHHDRGAPDILRQDGKPLIADQRNDENLIISQLHLALLLFHNKMVAELETTIRDSAACFAEARRLVKLHYHWLILNDFLPNLLSPLALQIPLAARPQRLPAARTVPLEFTTAAFRFGHSMIGSAYDFNANFGRGGKIDRAGASLSELFAFTSHGNMGKPDTRDTLQLPDHWVIDWNRMTRRPRPTSGPGGAEKIDLTFAIDMLNLMGSSDVAAHGSILFRNLMRGFQRRIAFGQLLAGECGLTALTPAELWAALPDANPAQPGSESLRAIAKRLGMLEEMPAWLYFLCEARHFEQGEKLGPTASSIIADTIVGLMGHMKKSIVNEERAWHPRQSPLRSSGGRALTSLRALVTFAVA